MAKYEIDDPCHNTGIDSIQHLSEVGGENQWECWCIQPCCMRDVAPLCICEFCSCQDPE
jgi:hypothetical protein